MIERRLSARTMGFTSELQSKNDKRLGELFAQVQPEDLLKFGMIPEFIGRLPVLELALPTIPSGGGRTPVLAGYVRGDRLDATAWMLQNGKAPREHWVAAALKP